MKYHFFQALKEISNDLAKPWQRYTGKLNSLQKLSLNLIYTRIIILIHNNNSDKLQINVFAVCSTVSTNLNKKVLEMQQERNNPCPAPFYVPEVSSPFFWKI